MPAIQAENVTPRQTRHFRVEFEDFNTFQVQSINMPAVEHDSVEVSDGQSMIKFPGLTKVPDLVMKQFLNAFAADDLILQWLFANGNPELGIAATPYVKKDGSIFETDAAGNDVQEWSVKGAWVKKVDGYSFDKQKSEAVIQEATISVDSCVPVFES